MVMSYLANANLNPLTVYISRAERESLMHPAFAKRFIMLIYLIALPNDSVCSDTYA